MPEFAGGRGMLRTFLLCIANMSSGKFYAVRVGRNTGVFNSWSECEAQVKKYPGAVFKSFQSYAQADSFVNTENGCGGVARGGTSNKWFDPLEDSYSGSSGAFSNGFIELNPLVNTKDGYGGVARGGASSRGRSNNSFVSSARELYSGNFAGGATRHHSSKGGGRGRGARNYCDSVSSSSGTSRPVVHVDGSCFGNGFKGAVAGIGVYWGHGNPHNISEKLQGKQTNQRAELGASCKAIESAVAQGHSAIEIRTDSKYTIKAATEWIRTWKTKDWKTSSGGNVKNKEDMEHLDNLCGRVDIKWTHVYGHVGIPGNEAADTLAKAGSMKS